MLPRHCPFIILGVSRDADYTELKESYKERMNDTHSDKINQHFHRELSARELNVIAEERRDVITAYEYLKQPQLREFFNYSWTPKQREIDAAWRSAKNELDRMTALDERIKAELALQRGRPVTETNMHSQDVKEKDKTAKGFAESAKLVGKNHQKGNKQENEIKKLEEASAILQSCKVALEEAEVECKKANEKIQNASKLNDQARTLLEQLYAVKKKEDIVLDTDAEEGYDQNSARGEEPGPSNRVACEPPAKKAKTFRDYTWE